MVDSARREFKFGNVIMNHDIGTISNIVYKRKEYRSSCLISSSLSNNDLFIVNEFLNKKIISQFFGIIKSFNQSGDRVSKNDKIYHICIKLVKMKF